MKYFACFIAFILFAGVAYYLGFNNGLKYQEYSLVRVVDGDTLITDDLRDDQEVRVRILGINAPEFGFCVGEESKAKLESLVVSEKIKIIKVGVDSFGRVVAKITIGGIDIAPEILRNGMAKVDDASKDHIKADSKPTEEYLKILREAESVAKNAELGVWSKECVSKEPKKDPNCNIKGNYRDGKRVYYLPSCSQYKNVVVEEQTGDSWFCTEKEAKTNGFMLASSCTK